MKRVLAFLCAVTMVLTMCSFTLAPTTVVVGTVVSPKVDLTTGREVVEVSTFAALRTELEKSANAGKTVKLTADIDLNPGFTLSYDEATGYVVTTDGTNTVNTGTGLKETTAGAMTQAEGDKGLTASAINIQIKDNIWLDGDGHTISGFYTETAQTGVSQGILHTLNANNKVANLNIKNSLIVNKATGGSASYTAGFLAIWSKGGEVYNCHVEDSYIIGANAGLTGGRSCLGGLIGQASGGNVNELAVNDSTKTLDVQRKVTELNFKSDIVDSCSYKGAIFSNFSAAKSNIAGGIVGNSSGVYITNCANYADVTMIAVDDAATTYGVGGIIGCAEPVRGSVPGYLGAPRNLTVVNCANYGDITGTAKNVNRAGALIGLLDNYWATNSYETLYNCFNGGKISYNGTCSNVFIGTNNGPAGTKTVDGVKYSAAYTGRAAYLYSVDQNGTGNGTGALSETCIYIKKNLDDYGAKLFGESTILGALNAGSMPFATRKWIAGEDGMPTLDFESPVVGSEANPRIISTAAELKTYRDAYNGMNYAPEGIYANIKLGADIDLNPGYTFGYDDTKVAPTVTYGGTTVYLGMGKNELTAGKWYDAENVETTAPGLEKWAPIGQVAAEHLAKIKLDGDGHRIDGIYLNQGTTAGFITEVYNADIKNLTLGGLVYTSVSNNTGILAGASRWDGKFENCVNDGIVAAYQTAAYGKVGGLVGYVGVDRGSGSGNNVEDFNSIANRINRDRRNRNEFIACGNTGVVVANNTKENANLGGVVGYASMIKAYLCYNEGQVLLYGGTIYGLAGVVGMIENGVNRDIPTWSKNSSGTNVLGNTNTGNMAAPLVTVIRMLGCYNAGRVWSETKNASKTAAVYGYIDAYWFGNGTTDFAKGEDDLWVNSDILKSEAQLQYNFNINTTKFGATDVVNVHGGQNGLNDNRSFQIKNAVQKGAYFNGQNNFAIGTASSNTYTVKQNASVAETLAAANKGITKLISTYVPNATDYFFWLDYKYELAGGPRLVKGSGISGYGTEGKPYILTTPEHLKLLNETASYVANNTTVTINGIECHNINEAKDVGTRAFAGGQGILANGTIGAVANIYTSANNAIAIYMAAAGAGAKANWNTTLNGLFFKLGNDIDMDGYAWNTMYDEHPYLCTNFGGSTPEYAFKGTFDGDGHTISGLNVGGAGASSVAIFGGVNGGKIKNLKIADTTVNGVNFVCGLATYVGGGSRIENVTLENTVAITATGTTTAAGFAGWQQGGTITNCTNKAAINATSANVVGGIVGQGNSAVNNCTNYGNITANTNVGGIIGSTSTQTDVIPSGNKNYGNIHANGNNAGGIMGGFIDIATATSLTPDSEGIIKLSLDNCHNYGEISAGGSNAGGIAGTIVSKSGLVGGKERHLGTSNSTNEGKVTAGTVAGGIAGSTSGAVFLDNCTNSAEVKARFNVGGITGSTGCNTFADNGNKKVGVMITNCTNDAPVTIDTESANYAATDGHDVAGIAAYLSQNTQIIGCTNTENGTITCSRLSGGIFGNSAAGAEGKVENCVNNGNFVVVPKSDDGDSYYIGGIGGQALVEIIGCTNNADITAKRLVGGIAGRADKNITNCTNKGDITSTGKGAFNGNINSGIAAAGGIVSDFASSNTSIRTISGCVNEGDVSTPEFCGAGGIATNIANATITDCVNKGNISGTALIGGIVAYATSTAADKPSLITKCTNEGAVHSKNGNTGGIIGWKNQSRTTVAYCINKGTVTCDAIALDTLRTQGLVSSDKNDKGAYKYTSGALPGGIIGTLNTPTNRLTSTLYGNVNLGKVYSGTSEKPNYGITPNAEGYWAYNFSIGATGNGSKGAFLVDGKVVDDEMMRSGLISAIINNINFKEEDFLQKNLWKAANGHYANGADLLFWGTSWTPFAEGSFVQPDGFENGNVMFIDENGYPTLDNTAKAPVKITEAMSFEDAMDEFCDKQGEKVSCKVYSFDTEKFVRVVPGENVPVNSYFVDAGCFTFYVGYGAGIRKSAPSGLRFETFVGKDYKETLGLSDTAQVEFGTVILPKSIAEHALEFTAEELLTGEYQKLDIKAQSMKSVDDNTLSYAASVVNVKDNYRDYVALSYMKVTENETVTYHTAQQELAVEGTFAAPTVNSNARSINYVAKQVIASESEAAYAPSIWNMIKQFAVDKAVID